MKHLYRLLLLLPLLSSCDEKVDKNVEWPRWSSRPMVSQSSLSCGTEKEIVSGQEVQYTATITDEFTELRDYTLEVKYGGNVVFSHKEALSGNTQTITYNFVMPYAAYQDENIFYPEISLTAYNVEGGFYTQRLSNESNLLLKRPAAPAVLYLVDENGKVVELTRVENTLMYRTAAGEDLSAIGSKVLIATAIKGGKVDTDGYVWGSNGSQIEIGSMNAIELPSTSGYGFKSISFDTYSFSIDNLVNLSITIDKATMADYEHGGQTYLMVEGVELVRDCELVFEGFGDLKAMLQPDRFLILSDKTAKFTGHSRKWNIYYSISDNWMMTSYQYGNEPNQLWVTGAKACNPLGGDSTEHELNYLKGDGKDKCATLAAIRESEEDYHIMLYLKEGFHIQLYRWIKWSTIVSLTSVEASYTNITPDGQYINAGPEFVPGVYELRVHITQPSDASGNSTKAEVSLTPCNL